MATEKNYLYFGGERADPPITAEFEFDESEVWNSTEVASTEPKRSIFSPKKIANRNDQDIDRGRAVAAASLPVNVPDWSNILHGEYNNRRIENGDDNGDYVNCDHEDGRIPPHVYLARTRIASFSVQEGMGRTLKGRDMRRVRNAIWKQTGFED